MDKKLTFEIEDNGKNIKCEELYSFENNNKKYMVYTDNTKDEDGLLRIYAVIVDGEKLLPIENDDEWAFVKETIETLQDDN